MKKEREESKREGGVEEFQAPNHYGMYDHDLNTANIKRVGRLMNNVMRKTTT